MTADAMGTRTYIKVAELDEAGTAVVTPRVKS
jgi:hypothetical protein